MSQTWQLEPEILDALTASIPDTLKSQKPNGQFGSEPWICRDQQLIFPLAVAWHLPQSPYHQDSNILEAIIRGGDALINDLDENGMWTFRKKDHSTWGQIRMPWTYSRWIRTYQLIRDAVDENVRNRWDKALTLGFEGISQQELSRIHNIPTHHAMALYCAGQVFDREDWRKQAQAFLHEIVAAQSPYGWWTENVGPVVAYNYVYVDALGVYYSMSGDEVVLEALDRSARFHAGYTYPDGSMVETVDERNQYKADIILGNPGFSHTPAGRGYLAQQHHLFLKTNQSFDSDYAANMLVASGAGILEQTAAMQDHFSYNMGDDALIIHNRPWFISLSAYVCEPADNRFRQDRQNMLSIFHDKTGLILGGGNTKLQPLWSTCTVGDTSLLSHIPGDEDPDFSMREGLHHVPDRAVITDHTDESELILYYEGERYSITIKPESDTKLSMVCSTTHLTNQMVEGHFTLLPHLGQQIQISTGQTITLDETSFAQDMSEVGWIEHNGWRFMLPKGSQVTWPVLPHNPYRKKGDATIDEARLVVTLPFSEAVNRYEIDINVL